MFGEFHKKVIHFLGQATQLGYSFKLLENLFFEQKGEV